MYILQQIFRFYKHAPLNRYENTTAMISITKITLSNGQKPSNIVMNRSLENL